MERRSRAVLQCICSIYLLNSAAIPIFFPDSIHIMPVPRTSDLVLILIRLIVDDVEEAELVHALGGGHDAEPVAELLLLEELLGPADNVSL